MEQINLFSGSIPFKVDKPIRLIELFAGIGAQAKALERMRVEFEHYRICEFDKYAVASYNAIHGTDFTTSDITKITADDLAIVDTDTYCYIMTYSFPCQDLSIAGKQNGMEKGSGTRSGLLWEVERLLDECTELPQVLLMENVTQVHGKKNADSFRQWCDKLESLGYKNYWEDLNAKDFGVPQNRNRTFMVSLLGDYTYEFPEGFPLEIRLKDVLEKEVDEKYYLNTDRADVLIQELQTREIKRNPEGVDVVGDLWEDNGHGSMAGRVYNTEGQCPTLGASHFQQIKYICVKQIGNLMPSKTRDNPNQGRLYDKEGLCPTLGAMQGGNRQPFIVEDFYKNREERIYEEYSPSLRADRSGLKVVEPVCLNSKGGRGGVEGLQPSLQDRVYDSIAISPAVTTSFMPSFTVEQGLRIRKLTPKECWRLMGFTDADFDKAVAVNSNTQLYKQAGNSIVVDVLMAIFSKLF